MRDHETSTGEDLAALLQSMSDRTAGARTKGSRFTHTEKLQFAQVCGNIHNVLNGLNQVFLSYGYICENRKHP